MKVYIINFCVLLFLVVATFVFDTTLELGELQGIVFRLYLFYGIIIQGIVNVITGIVFARKKNSALARKFFTCFGIAAALVGLIMML